MFCETGLVVTPFLPGDSMIFACGAVAASYSMNIYILFATLITAAILGDATNYLIGSKIGLSMVKREKPIIKESHIIKAEKFYKKYGGKAIVLSRFIPIVRTFAPFVAGIGKMNYKLFVSYNILGGVIWVTMFLAGGYLFGNMPLVKNNFSLVVITIILISLVPVIIEFIKYKINAKTELVLEENRTNKL